jgi:hypothetical protein
MKEIKKAFEKWLRTNVSADEKQFAFDTGEGKRAEGFHGGYTSREARFLKMTTKEFTAWKKGRMI